MQMPTCPPLPSKCATESMTTARARWTMGWPSPTGTPMRTGTDSETACPSPPLVTLRLPSGSLLTPPIATMPLRLFIPAPPMCATGPWTTTATERPTPWKPMETLTGRRSVGETVMTATREISWGIPRPVMEPTTTVRALPTTGWRSRPSIWMETGTDSALPPTPKARALRRWLDTSWTEPIATICRARSTPRPPSSAMGSPTTTAMGPPTPTRPTPMGTGFPCAARTATTPTPSTSRETWSSAMDSTTTAPGSLTMGWCTWTTSWTGTGTGLGTPPTP